MNDNVLRPLTLKDFVGQDQIKHNLGVYIASAKNRKEALDHCLFYAPPGLGKTTLANIIAREMGTRLVTTSGPVLQGPEELLPILSGLKQGDVLFIDEIHRLNHVVEEALYPAIEDFMFDIILGKGAKSRVIRFPLEKFTLIGATTSSAGLTAPMRARFGIQERLQFYTPEELSQIVTRSASILQIAIDEESARIIALRSRGTPRIANNLLKRIRDFASVKGSPIGTEIVKDTFEAIKIDSLGLDSNDHRILRTLLTTFNGGPVGLESLAATLSEDVNTLETVYEPYLLQIGFIARTPRGRMITDIGKVYIQKNPLTFS